jgi:acyl carrier protein
MTSIKTGSSFSRNDIQSQAVSVLNHMTHDWELDLSDGIGPHTRLMRDLAFESIDVVQFVVALEQSFDRKGLPFEKLFMHEGDYVDDICVSEVVDFLFDQLNAWKFSGYDNKPPRSAGKAGAHRLAMISKTMYSQ